MTLRSNGRAGLIVLALAAIGLGAGCSNGDKPAPKATPVARVEPATPPPARSTVATPLAGSACKREVDRSDPNETPFDVCPGPEGYALVVRSVEAGRVSADVLDPGQRRFPLDLQSTVTRHMAGLEGPAQWRVLTGDGRSRPIALVVAVQAHEDPSDPARVTRTMLALAKIDSDGACVVDVRPNDDPRSSDKDAWLDAAATRACAATLPPLVVDGQRK